MPETVVHFQIRMPPVLHEQLASWAKEDKASLNALIVGILEKACFAIPAVVLLLQNRIPSLIFGFAMVDVVLGMLFLIAYVKTGEIRPI